MESFEPKKLALIRIWQILEEHSDQDHPLTQEDIAAKLALCHPMLCDLLPLSLEEIFIYELGGVDYDVKNILL